MSTEELIIEFKDNVSNFARYLKKLFDEKGYDEKSYEDILEHLYDFASAEDLELWMEENMGPYVDIDNFESYEKYLKTLESYPKCKILSEEEFNEAKDRIDFLDKDMQELFITGMSYIHEDYYESENSNMPIYIQKLISETEDLKSTKE